MAENKCLQLSSLAHTWVLDFDGTLVKHNGYKTGKDEWLPGALEFLRSLPEDDFILILTAREPAARAVTESFLRAYGIRFNLILFGIPMGERILMNDKKPSGLQCAYAVNPDRNVGPINFKWEIDESL
jgi:hypothetical protein